MSFFAGVLTLLAGSNWGVSAESLSLNVGFDRSFKVGQWTPIIVDGVSPNASACDVVVTDPDGVRVVQPLARQTVTEANVPPRWTGVFRSGRLDAELEVRVLAEGPEPIQRRKLLPSKPPIRAANSGLEVDGYFPLRQSQPVWLEVGTASELLKSTETLLTVRSEGWPAAVETSWALDGIDGIWVTSQTPLPDAVRTELHRWLRRGGHLVVTITSDLEEFERSPWSELLKEIVTPRERTRINDLSGIESFTVHGRKIVGASRTTVTMLAPQQGRVLVSSLEGPLVTRGSFGVGQVTVLGIDPAVAPLSRWDGRTAFVKRLLLPVEEKGSAKSAIRSSLSQSGITDLASQWRAAAIDMPEVARPTLWGVLGLLLVYSVIAGPLDYLLVHKLLKRPQWTWGTLPLLVALSSVGTVWLARAANGDAARLTQLDVVDLDAGQQEVTSRSWMTAYATENALWRVDAAPLSLMPRDGDIAPTRLLSWLGFPENSSGGMYRASGFDMRHAVARSAPDRAAFEGIPIAQWSSKSLTSESQWVSRTPLVESHLTSSPAGELSGQVVHHLPFELHDWIVVFEKWVYRPHPRLGEAATIWPADQPWNPSDERNYGRELRGFLTRTTATRRQAKKGVVQEDVLVEQERYNPLNLDPTDILQMMTLHEAAGGKAYTGLDHHSLRAFDLSPLLSLDRAVVIARVAEPTSEWRINGEARRPTRHHGYVRFLLPVKQVGDPSGFRVLPKYEAKPVPQEQTAPSKKDTAP